MTRLNNDVCCELMIQAIEENTIDKIDQYEVYAREWMKIKPGYYILDGYATQEYCLKNYPADPKIPLNFCPWCGTDLVRYEDLGNGVSMEPKKRLEPVNRTFEGKMLGGADQGADD